MPDPILVQQLPVAGGASDDDQLPIGQGTDQLHRITIAQLRLALLQGDILQAGKSAYQLWLDAGGAGDVEAFLADLTGPMGPPWSITVANDNAAARTLAIGDSYIRMSSAAANTVTVPSHAATPIPVSTQVLVLQAGAGKTTIAAAAGVTINTAETLKLRKRFSCATLVKVAANEWDLVGDTEAA